jgi:hypothetical protein
VAYDIVGEASPGPVRSKAPSGSPRNSPDKQIEGGPECSLIAEAAANGGDAPLARLRLRPLRIANGVISAAQANNAGDPPRSAAT